jgi:hypothetical protein
MKNKEEVLAHLFNAYRELSYAEEELVDYDGDEYLDEVVVNGKGEVISAILKVKGRVIDEWMTIDGYNAIVMDDDVWESYKKGACLCFAKCSSECLCGSWDLEDDFYD